MGKKILVVDDEPDICTLIAEGLSEKGYEILSVHRGKDALKLLEEKDFDLVMLDIHLPEIDGTTIYEEMRKMVRHHRTPVIFLTALAQGSKPRLGGIDGVSYTIISKPANMEEIIREITRLLN